MQAFAKHGGNEEFPVSVNGASIVGKGELEVITGQNGHRILIMTSQEKVINLLFSPSSFFVLLLLLHFLVLLGRSQGLYLVDHTGRRMRRISNVFQSIKQVRNG